MILFEFKLNEGKESMPDGLLSFLVTLSLYTLFFVFCSYQDGNESNNQIIAMAAFVAMTFFINFPLMWWLIHKMIKEVKGNRH
ncbi:hypothetical protein [Ammoniphilus resinae]|nr:hypothetical protein [Ammoniphilus resinae]